MSKVTRVNFREIENHFEDSNPRIVGYQRSADGKEESLALEFYPEWLNPWYKEAQALGVFVSVDHKGLGDRIMTIYPKNTLKIKLKPNNDWGIDFWFCEEDELLLGYEDSGELRLTADITAEQWEASIHLARSKLSKRLSGWLSPSFGLNRMTHFDSNPSTYPGRFPRPVFLAIREALNERGIPSITVREPEVKQLPVIFYIDVDYIIAEDFDVDWPDWEHRPEWITTTPLPNSR